MRLPNKFNGYSADGVRLYNDPVTMAVVGATAGAAMNPDDPLKGAMIGGTLGYGGGAAMTGGFGFGAGTAAGTGSAAGTGGGFLGGGYGSVGLSGQTALTGGAGAGSGTGILSGTMAGLEKDMSAIGGFAQQNPVLSKMAADTAINSMQAPKPPPSGGMQQGNSGLLEMMAQYGQMPQKPFTQQNRISLL